MSSSSVLLKVHDLKKYYIRKKFREDIILRAVDGINLTIHKGETLGLVGESGCGKSTIGQLIGQLLEPTAGEVYFEGQDLKAMAKNERKRLRKDIQYIFQDAYSALNPRHKIFQLMEEPLIIQGIGTPKQRKQWIYEMLDDIGLDESYAQRYVHQLSGGQRQRVGIARALMLKPKLLILDEPVSALDVSVQSQILNLLKQLQRKYDLTYLFISHDLNVVHYMSDRVAVMYLGEIIEIANVERVYDTSLHPYTKALISSIPTYRRKYKRIALDGEIPSPLNRPEGCSLHTRCPFAKNVCRTSRPILQEIEQDQFVSCHL
ncbi:ABC transporter ATP-binding protein [Metabacillus fastidiosus]|uniref:ABC transporter ATP-binding protein n=1 Tax=Metabacillus fastidiosus TaxID=1458 RepID=UPI003D2E1A84